MCEHETSPIHSSPDFPMIFVLAAVVLLAQDTVSYAKPELWLCRPGRRDACAIDLSATVVQADGSRKRQPWAPAKHPAIDCFYIYPTVSRDTSEHSDMTPGEEERDVIRQQFARFASVCRPFAPMYRQVTLRGLNKMLTGGGAGALSKGIGYDDVAAAWAHYLARDNKGRGVVLIGHSQGAMILDELIRREIDGKPVQARIVSALLMGANIAVPKGKDVGGAFQSMPLCRRDGQTGCVISFVSFRSTLPPSARALFGRVAAEGMEAACTNPASLHGGTGALQSYFSTTGSVFEGTAAKPFRWVQDAPPFDTPFVAVPGLLTAECVSDANGSRLVVTVHPDPADPRADDIPGDIGAGTAAQAQWGLHLVDMSMSMGNLIGIVSRQSAAYRSSHKH